MITEAFLRDISVILGNDRVLYDMQSRIRSSRDAYARWNVVPDTKIVDAVAFPSSTEEVVQLVSLARSYSVPLVPRGGGTGLMGAAISRCGGLAIELKGLDQIFNINREDRTVQVQSGVILEHLNQALENHGLMLGHDPYSVPIATVGGTISTNSVGYRAGRYGAMGAQVLALEVVLASGEVLRTRATSLPSIGPDLNRLFVGSEGSFGIITEATLRVFSTPEDRIFQTFSFPSFGSGFNAVREMADLGFKATVLDLTEEENRNVILYLVFEGYYEEVQAYQSRARVICLKHEGSDIGPSGAIEYWETRHDSAYRYKEEMLHEVINEHGVNERIRRHGSWDYLHVSLPVSQIIPFYQRCHEYMQSNNIVVRESAVWTGPECFSIIIASNETSLDDKKTIRKASDWALNLAQDFGGTTEYCHGIGMKLEHMLEKELGIGFGLIQQIKRSIDPDDLLNSGKMGI